MPAHKMRGLIGFRLILLLIVFAALVINGCGGSSSSSSASPPAPNISLSPTDTDFGTVVLNKSSDKQILVQNTGTSNLIIGQIAQPNPSDNTFRIVSDGCSGMTISKSSSCSMIIRFSPISQADYSESIDIPSNDSDQGVLTATFQGKGRSLNVSIVRVGTIDPQSQTVKVTVSVTDKDGVPVNGLADSNFLMFENGVPKTIFSFSNIIISPVSVGMVLDYSSSMFTFETALETAAKLFIDNLNPAGDEAEIIKFATDIQVMQTFTTDKALLKTAIDAAPSFVRSGTRLYNALWDSIESTSVRSNLRRAIITVSDGRDSGSTRTLNEVVQNAINKNIPVFTIGVGNVDTVTMQQIASQTGGQYFFAPQPADLTSIYLKISEILSNQYTIDYTTSSASGSSVTIGVQVDDNGQLGEHTKLVTI